jgi:hypothetical protein
VRLTKAINSIRNIENGRTASFITVLGMFLSFLTPPSPPRRVCGDNLHMAGFFGAINTPVIQRLPNRWALLQIREDIAVVGCADLPMM